MKDSKPNKENIRKIIDPKSGFSLYVRKFSDSNISQVSTLDTFPIPDPNHHNLNTSQEEIITELKKVSNQNKKEMQAQQNKFNQLAKQNKQIKMIGIGLNHNYLA